MLHPFVPPDSLVEPGALCIHLSIVPDKPKKKNAIGFPPPLLGEQPYRLDVLASAGDWLALEKPSGVGTRAHPWDETPDLDSALNQQLEAGKPELQRTGADVFGSVYYLDPEVSGVALFAKNRHGLADLRNRFGSGECRFTFRFVSARNEAAEGNFQADAPLLPHRVKPKMIPSTAKGKKCRTEFNRLVESDLGWVLWEAQVDFFRPHQVRAHAGTHGISVLGDSVYGGPEAPTVRQLQPRARRSDLDSAVFSGLAVHLLRAEFSSGNDAHLVESPLPKPFALLLKRLGLSA
ncbi:pseudouridine synthase [Coraliomargarita sinensis]|uniref:pseudouridine synthase n=1 Tax=Coraliomargarita sinensis TaxID=2174842 RepID=UPI001304D696|nr:pseudouridine synthase [Coraliomargarita sinensis]